MDSLLLVQIFVVATFAAPEGPLPTQIAGSPLNRRHFVAPVRAPFSPFLHPESVHVPPVYTDLKVDPPSLKAALVYLTSQDLDACGRMFKVYLGQIQAGNSQEAATLAATAQYQQDWLTGNLERSAACVAADQTWRREYAHGRDPLLPSARAYIQADPNTSSPCKSAALDYIDAIVAGRSSVDASLAAFDAFAEAVTRQPAGSKDETCIKATMAYVEESSVPSEHNKAAMQAYMAQVLQGGQAYDATCLESAKAYMGVYLRGGSLEQANEAAAVIFLDAVGRQGAQWDENTACAKAAQAFIDLY